MIKKVFAHLTIVITVIMVVLIVIDGVNDAMGFLRGTEFKTLLIIYCVVSLLTAAFYIEAGRKTRKRYVYKKKTRELEHDMDGDE